MGAHCGLSHQQLVDQILEAGRREAGRVEQRVDGRLGPEVLVDWAVGDRGLRRVEWCCVPENESSRAVARRLGFRHEGTAREAFEHEGRVGDLETWALLVSDRV